MSANSDDRFLWMMDAGVPPTEVLWLRSMDGSPQLHHPVAARRVQEIMDLATTGLLATVKTYSPSACATQ